MMNNTSARRNRRRVRLDAMVFNLVMPARLTEGKVDSSGFHSGNCHGQMLSCFCFSHTMLTGTETLVAGA